ncbi:MAG: hypothetical protein A7315_04975 [Candidatus Altiarchaeales archaeon WOR_SM1_79]|nr:MAG: hypothetical protein A7315_04975 [Candidatus Altiarchaeales archaeon WOR_SM1_79]
MAEEKEYDVKVVYKKPKEIEEVVDEKIKDEAKVSPRESVQIQQPIQTPQIKTKKGFQIPQIPTQKIFKTLTDREMMMQTLHDETMEPHVHLTILLIFVFILAIIIGLLGI